jgi:hypothetical protein
MAEAIEIYFLPVTALQTVKMSCEMRSNGSRSVSLAPDQRGNLNAAGLCREN